MTGKIVRPLPIRLRCAGSVTQRQFNPGRFCVRLILVALIAAVPGCEEGPHESMYKGLHRARSRPPEAVVQEPRVEPYSDVDDVRTALWTFKNPDFDSAGNVIGDDPGKIRDLTTLHRFRSLKALRLFSPYGSLSPLANLPELHSLQILYAHNMERIITNRHGIHGYSEEAPLGLAELVTLPKLKHLYLQDTTIRPPDAEAIGRMTQLESLALIRLKIDDPDWKTADALGDLFVRLSAFGNLRFLSLSGLKLSERALPDLSRLPSLEVLDLSETDVTPGQLAALSGSTVKHLKIHHCPGVPDPSLLSETLKGCRISSDGRIRRE